LIDGLSLLVERQLNLNPFEAVLLVFINRRRDKIKILYWEKTGFACGTSVWRSDDLIGPIRPQQNWCSMVGWYVGGALREKERVFNKVQNNRSYSAQLDWPVKRLLMLLIDALQWCLLASQ
jgi:hypothetical protein